MINLTGHVQGMNLDPSMMNMMKDLDGAEMNKQLETLGLSPSEVINKIMAEHAALVQSS